jgi:DNA-binding response OmpR family regulator
MFLVGSSYLFYIVFFIIIDLLGKNLEVNMNKKVLIIEDDNSVGNLLKDLLETNNFEVDWALNGNEGYDKYSSDNYDLLIMDINMPELSGLELCKKIRQKPFGFKVPVIMLSVMDKLPDKFKGLCVGADEYLTKPFYVEGIMKRIPIVMEYKENKLLSHTLTELPSLTKCQERFTELLGSDYQMIYSDVTAYFDNVENYTEETINMIKGLGAILKKHVAAEDLFHLEGSNFCFFVSKKLLKKTVKNVLSDFNQLVKTEFKEIDAYVRSFIHLLAFNMKDKKDIDLLELSSQIEALDSKIIRDGHFAVSEKAKVIKKIL